jgi:hypothetical protein
VHHICQLQLRDIIHGLKLRQETKLKQYIFHNSKTSFETCGQCDYKYWIPSMWHNFLIMQLKLRAAVVVVNIFALSYNRAVFGLPRGDSAEISSSDNGWKVINSDIMWGTKRLLGRVATCQGEQVLCSGTQPLFIPSTRHCF